MKYLFVTTLGSTEIEKWIEGDSEKIAHRKFYESLSDEQKNAISEIECVDQEA